LKERDFNCYLTGIIFVKTNLRKTSYITPPKLSPIKGRIFDKKSHSAHLQLNIAEQAAKQYKQQSYKMKFVIVSTLLAGKLKKT